MRCNKILMGLGIWAMGTFGSVAVAAPTTGSVSFDVNAVSSTLLTSSSNFSGWGYYSEASSSFAAASDSASGAAANYSVSVAGAFASTSAASLFTSAQAGGVSSAYQRVTASFELAAGQHLVYEIPYSLTLNQATASQRLDIGLGFTIESLDSWNQLSRTMTTANWPAQGGQASEASSFVIDLTNTRDTAQTYYIVGTLRAEDYGPAAAVPEPANYAMLLVGLGVLAMVARKRNRVS